MAALAKVENGKGHKTSAVGNLEGTIFPKEIHGAESMDHHLQVLTSGGKKKEPKIKKTTRVRQGSLA